MWLSSLSISTHSTYSTEQSYTFPPTCRWDLWRLRNTHTQNPFSTTNLISPPKITFIFSPRHSLATLWGRSLNSQNNSATLHTLLSHIVVLYSTMACLWTRTREFSSIKKNESRVLRRESVCFFACLPLCYSWQKLETHTAKVWKYFFFLLSFREKSQRHHRNQGEHSGRSKSNIFARI